MLNVPSMPGDNYIYQELCCLVSRVGILPGRHGISTLPWVETWLKNGRNTFLPGRNGRNMVEMVETSSTYLKSYQLCPLFSDFVYTLHYKMPFCVSLFHRTNFYAMQALMSMINIFRALSMYFIFIPHICDICRSNISRSCHMVQMLTFILF